MDPTSYNLARRAILERPTPPYSAIVCKDGSTVWAEDSDGKTIASGEAGVDDAGVIQSALDALVNGGKIFIKAGTYTINKQIVIKHSNIELGGEGIDKTILISNIWEPGIGGTYSIIHSVDSEKLTGIFIHDLTIDSVYDYTTDITKVWTTGIELTNVDDSVIYRCKAKNHFGSVFDVGARERVAKQRHDDYLGLKAVMYCIAERCTGEIFSVTRSTKCALIGNQTKDLVLQPAGQSPDARWCHILDIESSRDVLVANNHIVGVPVDEPLTFTAAVNAVGALRAVIVNNVFEAPSVPETPRKVNAIYWYFGDACEANLEFSHNYIKNLTCEFIRDSGTGVSRNIRVKSNTIINGWIKIYVYNESGQDRTLADVDVSDNIIYLPDTDYSPIYIRASADPAVSLGENIKANGNIINAPVNESSWQTGISIGRATSAEIIGNLIKESPHIGVTINYSTYGIIKNNLIFNPGRYASLAHGACIYCERNNYLIIEGNVCVNPYSYAIRIEPISGGGGKVFIARNITKDCPYDVRQLNTDYALDYVELTENEFRDAGASISFGVTPSTLVIKRNKNYRTENSRTATFDGDGTTTDFLIGDHGLAITDPSRIVVKVTPISSDAIAASPCVGYVDPADNTKIRVKFASAPASGTGNVKIVWEAQVVS